jgi:hypothetical protein
MVNIFLVLIFLLDLLSLPSYNFLIFLFSYSRQLVVNTMNLQLKNLFIILFILCFWIGCTQVKQIVTDVKESITGEKKDASKAPKATDTGTTKEDPSPPAKAKIKETKTTPPPAKKGTPKTTQPPAEEVFGPK